MSKSKVIIVFMLLLAVAVNSAAKKPMTPQKYYEQVLYMFEEGLWGEGKVLLDEGMDTFKNDANLYYLAGRYWWHARDVDRARYYLVKCEREDDTQTDAKELLVSIEEATGNYSSAICYVNELLEVLPYSKSLWLRKIALYRKQGNDTEAEDMLRRLSRIYPGDKQIRDEYMTQLGTMYELSKSNNNISNKIKALSEIVSINPSDIEYQTAYINALLQQGANAKALEAARESLKNNPGNVELVRKLTDIMLAMGQYSIALNAATENLRQYPSAEMREVYNKVLAEASRLQNEMQPYKLYQRTYTSNPGNREALEYLISAAIENSYYDDVEYYVSQAIRRYGNTPKYAGILYTNYLRQGNAAKARAMLPQMVQDFPNEYDIVEEMCEVYGKESSEYMTLGNYTDAIPLLQEIIYRAKEDDYRLNAYRKLYECLYNTKRYEEAGEALAREERIKGADMSGISLRRAELLSRQGKKEEAMNGLENLWRNAREKEKTYYAQAYAEIAIPFIRQCSQEQDFRKSYFYAGKVVEMIPDSYDGLRYGCSSSAALGDKDGVNRYTTLGQAYYPSDLDFKIRRAGIMSEQGDKGGALELLEPEIEAFPANDELRRRFSGISDEYALELHKYKKDSLALKTINTALAQDPQNKSLLYTKGVVFEGLHQYDSAHFYQKNYQPSAAEVREYNWHMNYLKSRTFHNSIETGFLRSRFASKYETFGIGTVAWTHNGKKNGFEARINYTARDYYSSDTVQTGEVSMINGGRGLQGLFTYNMEAGEKLSFKGTVGVGYNFFPKFSAAIGGTWHAGFDWDLGAGLMYRKLVDDKNLTGFNISATKLFERCYLAVKGDTGWLDQTWYINGSGTFRYFPIEGNTRTYAGFSLGAGTAPELDVLNTYYTPSSFNHLNSFMSMGGAFLLTPEISLGLDASWHTLYHNYQTLNGRVVSETVKYRNLFNINVSLTIFF